MGDSDPTSAYRMDDLSTNNLGLLWPSSALKLSAEGERLATDYDILMAYLTLLGRNPIAFSNIWERTGQPLKDVLETFLESPEFNGLARAADVAEFELTHQQLSWVASLFVLTENQSAALRSASSRKHLFNILKWIASGRPLVARTAKLPEPRGEVRTNSFTLIELETPNPGDPVRAGDLIEGRGWVIAQAAIQQIAVYWDEALLCHASYGLPRAGVVERFPQFAQAEQSGFEFSALPPARSVQAGRQHRLVLRILTADGTSHEKILPLAGEAQSKPAADGGKKQSEKPPIQIFIDQAEVDAKQVLRVSGWIASLQPLLSVRLFLDQQELEAPEFGRLRPDVAMRHPTYANAGNSGFELVQDIGSLIADQALLRITAVSTGGIQRQAILPLKCGVAQHIAPAEPEVTRLYCDSSSVRSDGLVSAVGWAVSAAGVQAVSLALNGAPIGEAEIGLSRPDVGNQFPRIPSARQSGFKFAKRLGQEFRGEHVLTLIARSSTGGEKELRIALSTVEAAGDEAASDTVGGQTDEFRVEIDTPHLKGDRALEPMRGVLSVTGWAMVDGGVAAVEVQVDERQPVAAYVGVRREDVAATFPELESALFSGFALTLPHRAIGEGEHTIRLLVRAKSGRTLSRAFRIRSERPEEETAGRLRLRLVQSEIDLRSAVLRASGHRPRFEISVHVGRSTKNDLDALQQTLATLAGQAYDHWRVLLVLPAGFRHLRAVERLTEELGLKDRAQPVPNRCNPPAASSGDSGRLVLALRAGDRLGADALLEFAVATALDPHAELVYPDERCDNPHAGAVRPWRKPDWSPELLLAANYLGRAWCATPDLLRRAGLAPHCPLAGGDYDAVLRLTEQARSIAHIPRVLAERGAAADNPESERWALQQALARRSIAATVLPGRAAGTWRAQRALGQPRLVSIIIPTCAARGLIETVISSIRERTAYPRIEIVAVDNIPPAESQWKRWLADHADRIVIAHERFNWARFNNRGAAAAGGEFLLFLNDDIEVRDPGWLAALIEHAQNPEVGVVGAQLLYPDGKVQHAGMFLSGPIGRHAFRYALADEPGPFGQALVERNVTAVTGACIMVRRDAFALLGGFDEAHEVVNNDLDFCLRAWDAGLRVVYTPHATLVHHEFASRAKLADTFDAPRFRARWGRRLAKGDPFFNPALTPDSDDYQPEAEPVEVIHAGHPLIARARLRRILAVKLDHIGDFLTALPAFRRLKQHFPHAELTVLAAKASLAVAEMEPALDHAIEFNFYHARSELGARELDEGELAALRQKLARQHFDLALDLRLQTDTRPMLRHTGAAWFAGFDHAGRFPWLDVALEWEGDAALLPKRMHITDRMITLVDAIAHACEPVEAPLRTAMPLAEALVALMALPALRDAPAGFFAKPLVAVHPGAGNPMRQWPTACFTDLIELLVAEEGVHVLLIGGPDEAPLAREIEATVTAGGLLSLVGKTSLRDLPTILQASALFVGNDSGPKHIAAALGLPTVGVHSGNVDAREWAPRGPYAVAVHRDVICGPCYLAAPSDCPRRMACLTGIRPSDVWRACQPLLRLRADFANEDHAPARSPNNGASPQRARVPIPAASFAC